jgi:hypothetical protein
MAKKELKVDGEIQESKGWVALKDFALFDKEYKEGEVVEIPAGWVEDPAFDEFRNEKRRPVEQVGTAFSYYGDWIDKKANERQVMREILPVKKG